MTTDNLEKFQHKYQAGKQALEKGQYRLSIENLEAAQELIPPNSRRGGEAGIWLVTAYQAANQINEAIALCQDLVNHPDSQTREQAQRILYIINAPKLQRPKEWMSEIPDLTKTDAEGARYLTAQKPKTQNASEPEYVDLDLSQVETQDNQFVWFALILIILLLGSLVLLNKIN
ncbi:MAG: outer membrane protein assembly factor BamD [Waterburya sp.]